MKLQLIGSSGGSFLTASYVSGMERWLSGENLAFLDWEKLYLAMLEFKEERGFHNLVVRPEHPRQILEADDPKLYGLICDEALLKPVRVEQAERLQAAMASVLKKYMENFYRKRQQRWDSEKMEYKPLAQDDLNFQDWSIKVPRSDPDLVKAVKAILDEGKRIYKEFCSELPGIYLERHLYQPLLIQRGSKVRCAPPALNESERRFVSTLLEFCQSKPASLKGKEIFLLRNLSRGKGIGFFEESGFYPDFILWVAEGTKQRLVFVEPHGMLLEEHPSTSQKVNLYKKLQAQLPDARKKSKNKDLMLDSFIVSATPYDDLRKKHGSEWDRERYAAAHILFCFEEGEKMCLDRIFQS